MKTLAAFPFIILMVLLAVGCEPEPTHYWYNPIRTLDEAIADCQACQKRVEAVRAETDATRESQSLGLEESQSREDKQRYDDRVDTLDTWDEVYLKNVFSGCMQGRGYFEVEVERLPKDLPRKSLKGAAVAGR